MLWKSQKSLSSMYPNLYNTGYLQYMLETATLRGRKYATLSSLLINNANSTTIHNIERGV